jgi:hypothetical protein
MAKKIVGEAEYNIYGQVVAPPILVANWGLVDV